MKRALLSACGILAMTGALAAQASYVSNRVYVGARKDFADFETLVADVAHADVVFVGEQHDDINTHRLELALLEGLLRRQTKVVLSLEMFERDVAEPLAHFAMGHMDESEFLAQSRPWPQYQRDYKPLVDLALAHQWPVVAADVPRDIAAAVSKGGLDALRTRPETEKGWYAKDLQCEPRGDYFTRFKETMSGHGDGGAAKTAGAPMLDEATVERYYASQCLKDETMAESIAQAQAIGALGGQHAVVVHVTGSFHAEYGEGTVERTRRRLPGKKVVVVTMLPTADLDAVKPDKDARKLADYVVYTYRRQEHKP
jgi:uncharacterized iron-regulated protein